MQLKATPDVTTFKELIWQFYEEHGRSFPWRNIDDPYRVVVSEIMLQQTQTYRVVDKYLQFIQEFDSFESLANATLKDVLSLWQGLGYNRRGKYLHDLAKIVVQELDGVLPDDPEILVKLPGIGPATAASICAFAFNRPTIFIETNIRAVFIHHFFNDSSSVHDKELMPLIEQAVDQDNPREWYYALMDYGVMLKKQLPNPSRKSAHHSKQSKFEGSDRQIRGAILRLALSTKNLSKELLLEKINKDSDRVSAILDDLSSEQLITIENGIIAIK